MMKSEGVLQCGCFSVCVCVCVVREGGACVYVTLCFVVSVCKSSLHAHFVCMCMNVHNYTDLQLVPPPLPSRGGSSIGNACVCVCE